MFEKFIKESYQNILKNKEALNYLLERGVSLDQIEKYQFGVTKKGQRFPNTREFMDWSRNGTLFINRFVFPLRNSQKKIKAIGTRPFRGKGSYLYYYFNRVDATFFGIENLKEVYDTKICYLTEGIFDHLVLEKVFPNALCSLSANVSQKQIRFLKRYIKFLILVLDIDKIGNEKAKEIIENNPDLLIYRIDKFLEVNNKIKDLNNLYMELGFDKFKEFLIRQNNLFVF